MHRRDPFDPSARRIMHRTQLKGDKPSEGCCHVRYKMVLLEPGMSIVRKELGLPEAECVAVDETIRCCIQSWGSIYRNRHDKDWRPRNLADITLITANKNYCLWPLPVWLCFKIADLEFDEIVIPFGDPDARRALSRNDPNRHGFRPSSTAT